MNRVRLPTPAGFHDGDCIALMPANRITLTIISLIIAAAVSSGALPAAAASVFQYTVPVTTEKNLSAAFLWIPSEARQVRGVVMAGMTLMEREFVKDPLIRKACADEQLAIVFLKCGLGAADLQKVLGDFAKLSGYRELPMAPLFFVGHSAGGPQAKARAIGMSSRCFGLMQYRGGVPGGQESVPPGVPALMMVGQFDEFGGMMRDDAGREAAWESGTEGLVAFRMQNERNLGSIVVEPGAGHFAWSERNAAYLALFLRKAAQARIPDWSIDAKEPVQCKEVDHQRGWLTALAMKTPGEFHAAPHEEFKGGKSSAAWHFDKEMAEATVAYHAAFGRKDQFVKWTDAVWVDAGVRYFFTGLKWVGDGQTFEVHPEYAHAYPQQQTGGPRWAQSGQPAGQSKAPILVRQVSGPVIATAANTLRMHFDNLSPATEGGRVTFMASSEGDTEYRHTEQIGMMPRGFVGLKNGKDQSITFEPLAPLRSTNAPAELRATSTAGLPVEFYVAHGPASIADGKLRIAELPARATFPIEVKVVAWQFGCGIEPLVKTAMPVEQTISIEAR